MALRMTGVTPSQILDQPAFTTDGSAGRVRTYSGEIAFTQDSGVQVFVPGQVDAAPTGFVPPDAAAIRTGSEATLAAEVTIGQILTTGSADKFSGAGAASVAASLQADQNDPAWSWPHLSFQALGNRPMVLRYRLTVLTPDTSTTPGSPPQG